MSNPAFFSLAALVALLLIAFALVYPQGLGARSLGPFGHPVAPLKAPAPPPAAETPR